MFEQNGLALSSGGLTSDDLGYRGIVVIVWSREGQAAALAAQGQGYPALCGVDWLLEAKLGDRYGKFDQDAAAAGSVVGGGCVIKDTRTDEAKFILLTAQKSQAQSVRRVKD